MKKLILLLLVPCVLFAQENVKKNEKKTKPDATSSATKTTVKKEAEKLRGNISGNVIHAEKKEGLEFATVSLTYFSSNLMVEGTITDAKGKFLFNNMEIGKYNLTISYIGFETKTITIETTKSKPDIKIQNIELAISSKILNEVTIEDQKLIYENKIDKIVYNAENDLNSSENDATDVLRKAPLLSVDLEGNVSLRGNKNIKFLVNGKSSSFFTSDVATALQMIPADQIKSVEVITSPGAKYDGEGDAGIVNIITKKSVIDGYKATIEGMTGTKVNRIGLNLNIGKGRFGLSANGGMHGSLPNRIGTDSYERMDWDNIGDTNTLKQNGTSENTFTGYHGNISAFYEKNAYNSINSNFQFGGRTMPNTINSSTIYTHGSDTNLSYTKEYDLKKTDRTLNMEWTTDYTKQFVDKPGKELVLAIQLGGDINDGNTDIEEDGTIFYNQNDEKVVEETFQVDYTHPFGKSKEKMVDIPNEESERHKHSQSNKDTEKTNKMSGGNKLEMGGKIINRDNEIVYSDQENTIYQLAEQFDYNQKVAASYLSTEFALPLGLGLKTGIRYEFTQTSGTWKNNTNTAFENNYSNLLPNIVLSKSFSPMRSIKLSYNQRITRPSVKQINPNQSKNDNRNITIGNSMLDPTIMDQIEFSINSFGRLLQGSFQLYYKHADNVIESFMEIEDDKSIFTFKNIGETQQIGGNFFGSINLKKLSFRGSIDLYNYNGRDASLGYEQWTKPVLLYSYHMGGSYNLGNNWKAEMFGFFRSPTQTIQGTIPDFSMISIGIKKDFKNKRGSLGFRMIDPLHETKDFTTELSGSNFSQYSTKSIPFRSFAISFKYTFGKLNFKDVSTKTNIKNDDIQKNNNNDF